jgi:hypothetical protein
MPWVQDILAMDASHTQALPRASEQLDATLRPLRPSSSVHAQAVPAASTTPLMTTPQIQTVSVEILAATPVTDCRLSLSAVLHWASVCEHQLERCNKSTGERDYWQH